MTTRWEVEQAVLRSDLDPPARLLMLVLAVKTDNESAVVPPEFTPSLSTLAAATGLSRSTVADHLNRLEARGWVKRSRPVGNSRDERTCYALAVGSGGPAGGLVREADHPGSPGGGLGVVREADPGSPGGGHAPSKNSSTKSSSSKSTKRSARKRADVPRPDVDEICSYLADRIEGNGSKRPAITEAWRRDARLLLDEDRPIQPTVERVKALIDWCQDPKCFWHKNILSMPTLRKQYDRVRLDALDDFSRKRGSPRGGHEVYRNPVNQDDYDAWKGPKAS